MRPGSATIICTHLWIARQLLAEALGESRDHGCAAQLPPPALPRRERVSRAPAAVRGTSPSARGRLRIDVPTASVSVIDYPDGTWPRDVARSPVSFFERGVPSRALVRAIGYKPGRREAQE